MSWAGHRQGQFSRGARRAAVAVTALALWLGTNFASLLARESIPVSTSFSQSSDDPDFSRARKILELLRQLLRQWDQGITIQQVSEAEAIPVGWSRLMAATTGEVWGSITRGAVNR